PSYYCDGGGGGPDSPGDGGGPTSLGDGIGPGGPNDSVGPGGDSDSGDGSNMGSSSSAVRGGMGSLFRTIGTLAAAAITANSARGMKDSATAAMICSSKTEVFYKSST
ncbi:hypothetical protein Ancab_032954, partial [Ancistrocladus abbreviatus]